MKKLFTIGILIFLLASLFPTHIAKAAEDDITGNFFEEEMRYLIKEGIMKGYGDNTYLPDKPVRRSEFTAFLTRALDLELKAAGDFSIAEVSEAPSYSDVQPGEWFYPAVNAASTHGLVNGYPNNTFRPHREITRQEMAVMILRAVELKGVVSEKAPLNFTDADEIQDIYVEAVQRLIDLGLLTGKKASDGKLFFDPYAQTTRSQTAGVIVRMLKLFDAPESLGYSVATVQGDGDYDVVKTYKDYSDAKANASGSQVILNGNNIVWINDGLAVSNKYTEVYTSSSFGSTATYVTSGVEMKYLEATPDWVKVQVADTTGYVKPGTVNLTPSSIADKRSHYTVKDGNLIHSIYNPITDSTGSYVYGKAPSFLSAGQTYYSWNGNTFYNTSGAEVGSAYQYFNRMPLYTETQYTAEQLDAFLEAKRPGSPLIGLGSSFKKAENLHGTNAMYLLAHAIHESRWGESDIARLKNNLFGINAKDEDPFKNAYTYDSYEAGILAAAEDFIVPGYFSESDWRFNGAHLGNKSTGMNVRYASDPYWGQKIAGYMLQMDQYLSSTYSLTPELGQQKLAVTKQNTNVRDASNTSGTKLYTLETGSTLQVLEEVSADGIWYKVAPKNIQDKNYLEAYVYSHGGSHGTLLNTLNVAK
ncbi:S-layer protein [Halobacillus fulvus]|nr:S-layer protein [Halobacillus fulvus]